jgi:hypothetical protein
MDTCGKIRGGGGAAGAGGSVESGDDGVVAVSGLTPAPSDDADAPSKLLAPLLVKHVLARVAKPWLAVVVANELPRAGQWGAVPLKLADFLGSIERLAWAKDNGCPWDEETCALIAAGGHLDVLQWARAHGCPWNSVEMCANAASGGHLEVLQWVREHGCEWSEVIMTDSATR